MKHKKLTTKGLCIAAFMIFIMFNTYSQSIEGDWYGKANIQGIELRLVCSCKVC